MYTGGKRRLYLELPSWQYLPLPPHFQKVRKITIYFYFKKCSNFLKISPDFITLATLRAIQGIGAAAMVPAGVSPNFAIP